MANLVISHNLTVEGDIENNQIVKHLDQYGKQALTVSTNFLFTPTENGWLQAWWAGQKVNATSFNIYFGDAEVDEQRYIGREGSGYQQPPTMICPVRKGQTYRCVTNNTSSYRFFFFPNI